MKSFHFVRFSEISISWNALIYCFRYLPPCFKISGSCICTRILLIALTNLITKFNGPCYLAESFENPCRLLPCLENYAHEFPHKSFVVSIQFPNSLLFFIEMLHWFYRPWKNTNNFLRVSRKEATSRRLALPFDLLALSWVPLASTGRSGGERMGKPPIWVSWSISYGLWVLCCQWSWGSSSDGNNGSSTSPCWCPSSEWRCQIGGWSRSRALGLAWLAFVHDSGLRQKGWHFGVLLFSSSIFVRWSSARYGSIGELGRFVSPSSVRTELGLSSVPPWCQLLRNNDPSRSRSPMSSTLH